MAFLSLGNDNEDEGYDNEEEEEDHENKEHPDGLGSSIRKKHAKGTVDGLAQFRDMLQPTDAIGLASPSSLVVHHRGLVVRVDPSNPTAAPPPPKGKKPRKRKRKNKYADICMFAELLEVQVNDGSLCMDSKFCSLILRGDVETYFPFQRTTVSHMILRLGGLLWAQSQRVSGVLLSHMPVRPIKCLVRLFLRQLSGFTSHMGRWQPAQHNCFLV